MEEFHGTAATAFEQEDTPIVEDTRIQNLDVRDEDVFASAPLEGTDGQDKLTGNVGDDTLDGGIGKDRMAGRTGNDTYIVDNKNDKVTELRDEGDDTIESSISFALPKFVENLILTGNADINGTGNELDNVITGNGGANRLKGGAGDDTLEGGAGDDFLEGNKGNDTFVFAPGFGHDQILDFSGLNTRGADQIQFDASIFADFESMMAATVDTGKTLTITAGDDVLILRVKDVALLNPGDFTFV